MNELTQAFFEGQDKLLEAANSLVAAEPTMSAKGLLESLRVYRMLTDDLLDEFTSEEIRHDLTPEILFAAIRDKYNKINH